MKIKDTHRCRFCNEETEDCYHLLIECTKTIQCNQIRKLRDKLRIKSRESFNSWIYRQSQPAIEERRQLLNALKDLEVEL